MFSGLFLHPQVKVAWFSSSELDIRTLVILRRSKMAHHQFVSNMENEINYRNKSVKYVVTMYEPKELDTGHVLCFGGHIKHTHAVKTTITQP